MDLTTVTHNINALVTWILNNKELIGIVIGGSGVVSVILQNVKRWLSLQKPTVITAIHYALALLAVGAHYVAVSHSGSPTIIFMQALIVLGTNQFVYPLFTKPMSNLLSDAKAKANVQQAVDAVTQTKADFAG